MGPHSEVRSRERKSVNLGCCFYWGWGWGPAVSWAHSLLVSFKHKSGNLKRKRKNKRPKSSVNLNQPRSLKQRRLVEVGGGCAEGMGVLGDEGRLALYLAMWVAMGNVFIWDRYLWKRCLFEMEGCLSNQSLSQAFALQNRKPTVWACATGPQEWSVLDYLCSSTHWTQCTVLSALWTSHFRTSYPVPQFWLKLLTFWHVKFPDPCLQEWHPSQFSPFSLSVSNSSTKM